jgi:hypothetical protein
MALVRLGDSGSHSNDNLISNNNFIDHSRALVFVYDGRLAINNIVRFNTFAYNDYGVTIDYLNGNINDLITRHRKYRQLLVRLYRSGCRW